MIEVAFTESAGGSLKLAQTWGKGKCPDGPVAFICEDGDDGGLEALHRMVVEEHRRKWEAAIPLGGSPRDVYYLPLGLSVGSIAADPFGPERLALLQTVLGMDSRAKEQLETARTGLDAILVRTAQGETVRLWYSNNPDEMCGFYHILSVLPENCSIRAVKLPDSEERGGNLRTYTGWGEIEPGAFGHFLPLEREVTELFRRSAAARWKQLRQENAPVRAVLNGKLVSAGEGLYDFYIQRELDACGETFHEGRLIGDIIGKYQLGVSDWFIHQRIDRLVRAGKLEQVEPDAEGYRRHLRKNGI